jgi:hypothetical protein
MSPMVRDELSADRRVFELERVLSFIERGRGTSRVETSVCTLLLALRKGQCGVWRFRDVV